MARYRQHYNPNRTKLIAVAYGRQALSYLTVRPQ